MIGPVTAVEIVRPKLGAKWFVSHLISDWFGRVPFTTWIAMLLLGACHATIDSRIPAFGFVQVLLGLYTLRLIVSFATAWDSYEFWTRKP